MKIYRLSQNLQIIPQNTTQGNNPDVQLQNLQTAQEAIANLENILAIADKITADLRELEDTLGIGDIGLRNQVAESIKQAIMKVPSFNILAQMNFISSVDNLLNQNQINSIKVMIKNNISSIQSGQAKTQ